MTKGKFNFFFQTGCEMVLFSKDRQNQRITLGCTGISLLILIIYHTSPTSDTRSAKGSPNTDLLDVDQVRRYENGWRLSDDPDFIRYIRHRWLVNPSKTPRAFAKNKQDRGGVSSGEKLEQDVSQFGQSSFVDKELGNIENGFFVECGAADGTYLSNTLFFEKARNWTGLLIEANPKFFQSMLSSGRNAYMINACLSTNSSSGRVTFVDAGVYGGIQGETFNPYVLVEYSVQSLYPDSKDHRTMSIRPDAKV